MNACNHLIQQQMQRLDGPIFPDGKSFFRGITEKHKWERRCAALKKFLVEKQKFLLQNYIYIYIIPIITISLFLTALCGDV